MLLQQPDCMHVCMGHLTEDPDSLQGTSWGWVLLSLIQWSLSTRDKLGVGPLSLIQWSLSTRDKLGDGVSDFRDFILESYSFQRVPFLKKSN